MNVEEIKRIAQDASRTRYEKSLLDSIYLRIKTLAKRGYFEHTFSIFDKIYPKQPEPSDLATEKLSELGFAVEKISEVTYKISWH